MYIVTFSQNYPHGRFPQLKTCLNSILFLNTSSRLQKMGQITVVTRDMVFYW